MTERRRPQNQTMIHLRIYGPQEQTLTAHHAFESHRPAEHQHEHSVSQTCVRSSTHRVSYGHAQRRRLARLPVQPEPHQLGPPAYSARHQRQARSLERCLPVVERLRHVRQPAAKRNRRAQRRGCRPVVWLELLIERPRAGLCTRPIPRRQQSNERISPVQHRLVSLSVLIMLTALAPSTSAQDATELAKQTQNPVSSLISVPLQGSELSWPHAGRVARVTEEPVQSGTRHRSPSCPTA